MADSDAVVLLVDDDPENLAVLERILHKVYRTLQARDGEEALEILRAKRVDVIITDQRMPRVSGTQLLERSLEINDKIVKIILSAYTDTTDILSAINVCRINHYLVKPVSPQKILEVVKKALAYVPQTERYGL